MGGGNKDEASFVSLQCSIHDNNKTKNDNDRNVSFSKNILFNNKILTNVNLNKIQINSGSQIAFSFFISNNEKYGICIFIITTENRFNIYSLDNDNWILKYNKRIDGNISFRSARALLFDQS